MSILDNSLPTQEESNLTAILSQGFHIHYTWSNTSEGDVRIQKMLEDLVDNGYEVRVLTFGSSVLVLKKSSLPQVGDKIEKILQDQAMKFLPNFAGTFRFPGGLGVVINLDRGTRTLSAKIDNHTFRLRGAHLVSLDGSSIRLEFFLTENPLVLLYIVGSTIEFNAPLKLTLEKNGSFFIGKDGNPIIGIEQE